PARDQHFAGHDEPLAGAHVRPRGGHQLRGPVPAAARRRRTGQGARPAMNAVLSQPVDVKLMNITASVLFVLGAVLLAAAFGWWALRHPLFAIGGITVDGDVSHSSEATLRANVAPRLAGNFFTLDLRRAREAFEDIPWVRQATVRRQFPNRLRVELQEHQ